MICRFLFFIIILKSLTLQFTAAGSSQGELDFSELEDKLLIEYSKDGEEPIIMVMKIWTKKIGCASVLLLHFI